MSNRMRSCAHNASTLPYVYDPSGSNWLYQRGSDTRYKTASGNTASMSGAAFTYGGFNRLATAQTTAETTTYTYNALGERIKKINQNGLSTVFHYGPDGELLYEQDANGNTKAYVWLDGRPLARIDNDAQIYYYHVDHLATPQAMTDAAGTAVWKADYEPFGKATVKVSTVENNLRFPGQYYDRETGLHYNYFRDYDPGTGRYVEADPIGLEGGINIYRYVNSNPLTYVDRDGLRDPSMLKKRTSAKFPNGNLRSGYEDQDWVCSSPAGLLNESGCTKQCCIEHDRCYEQHKCNASSWGGTFSSDCQRCNLEAVRCVVTGSPRQSCLSGCSTTFIGVP